MNDQDIYIEQLRELFDSYDVRGTGYLNLEKIKSLCNQLQLPENTLSSLMLLLKEKSDGLVSFLLFKDSFVALLMQSSVDGGDLEEDSFETDDSDREVSPKFTIGSKQYGRRSRPGSMIENDDENSLENKAEVRPIDEATQQPTAPLHTLHTQGPGQPESPAGSPEVYLQGLWEKVGIERKDSLNVRELAVVCGHIGMDMSDDMVVQLFEKLDCDHDGRVTFDELLQCLFHHADVSKPLSETSFSCSPQSHAPYRRGSEETLPMSDQVWESGIFSSIDPDNTGYAATSTVVEFWESLGFNCGGRILHSLGFGKAETINLQNLSLMLEEELLACSPDPTYQVALTTLQKEVRTLKSRCLHLQAERDKLRAAVAEANERAALLAQEIDEHHSKLEATSQTQLIGLERKHQEQLRELEEENRSERELVAAQANSLCQKLEGKLQEAQESEAKALKEVAILRQENQRFEKELSETNTRCEQAVQLSSVLQVEVDSLSQIRRQLVELQSAGGEDQRCEGLRTELEELRKQNKDLQDHVDEMSLQMENMKLHLSTCRATASGRHRHNRTSSWLADYNRACDNGSNLKRRGSGSSSSSEEDESSRTSGKMKRKYSADDSSSPEKKDSLFGAQILEEEMELDSKIGQGEQLYQLLQPFLLQQGKGTAEVQGPNCGQTDELLKELYVENARLMRELQLAEEQHHRAEQCNVRLQFKCKVLGKLLADVTHVSAS